VTCGAPGEIRAAGRRLRTYAWPRPGHPRALLLHSLAAHGHWWDWAAPLLAERFDVLALDFRGHGGSDHVPDGAYGFEEYAADVLAVLDALGGAPPLAIGHSMGGFMSAWVAARHPGRLAGVVVTDILTAWPAEFAEFARRQAERASPQFASPAVAGERFQLSPPEPPTHPERVRHLGETGVVERGPGAWTYAFDRRVFLHPPVDPWPLLPQITCPALVINGERSTVMDDATCRAVAAAIPRARAATLPAVHHHMIVEAPGDFSALVLDWHRTTIPAPPIGRGTALARERRGDSAMPPSLDGYNPEP
jgi:pimeloyl-ACP methyl ester carboxylesterase